MSPAQLSTVARLMARVPRPLLPAARRLGRIRPPSPSYGPGIDLAWPGAVTRSVIVASESRTGSTLLCRALEQTGAVGAPHEHFNNAVISRGVGVLGVPVPTAGARWRQRRRRLGLMDNWFRYDAYDPSTFSAYVDEVIRRRTGPSGVFSAKIQWTHVDETVDRYGFDLTSLPAPITWIHIERLDVVAQAVSISLARQTGDWRRRPEGAAPPPPAHYDDDLLLASFDEARRAVEQWNAVFAARDIEPIRVTYEALAGDYDRTVRRVFDALDLHDVPVPPAGLQRQADAVNADWAARFRAAHPDLVRNVPTTDGT